MTLRLRRARVRAIGCFLMLVASTTARAQSRSSPPVPPQSFATRTDIVLVDVTVIDAKGQPVVDLTAADFSLSVAGRPRGIQSAQFVNAVPARSAANLGDGVAPVTSSQSPAARRLLIVVDESNLGFGANRAVLRAAESLLDRVGPADFVGLARLPDGDGVDFTNDRSRVIDGLRRVTGRSRQTAGIANVSLSEAVDFDAGGRLEWPEAVRRECAQSIDPNCVDHMATEARSLLVTRRAAADATVRGLERLLTNMRPLGVPVNMVLISEGLFIGRGGAQLQALASLAAAARTSMHIVRPAADLYDISDRGSFRSRTEDDRLNREGLELLAGQLRGGYYTVTGSGESVFDRIGAELSGYYLLGFEPNDEDRTGLDRRIRVEVRRRNVSIRARSMFALAPPPTVAASTRPSAEPPPPSAPPPVPIVEVPVRVATYAMTNSGDRRVRVLVSAEVGGTAVEASSWKMALTVVDGGGNVVSKSAGQVSLSPARAPIPSPALFTTSLLLDPGDYTLRLASVGDGRIGNAEHRLAAHLRAAPGGFEFSDLVVASEPGTGEDLRLTASGIVDRDRMVAIVEARHSDPSALATASVRFEVAQTADGPPILTSDAGSEARPDDPSRVFAGALSLGALPPGEYFARAVITVSGAAPDPIVRPFRLERPVSTTAARPSAPPAALTKVVAMVPRFSVEQVLGPDVVRPFINELEQRHPSSASVRPMVEQARSGKFTAASTVAGPDAAMLSFLAGLEALQAGRLSQATTFFQQTLRRAPDFVGVAFYLGACHAASGRDREAIGAWQMSLLSQGAQAAYPVLVDAFLRVGDSKKALEFLEESPDAWGTSQARVRREAIAQTMAGNYAAALRSLITHTADLDGDVELLFLGIQALYGVHLTVGLAEAERARFVEWADRYEKLAGAERPLVRAWRDHVVK